LRVGINEFLKSLNDNGLLPSIYSIPDMESYVEGIAYPPRIHKENNLIK
jgi:hypothetical protein